MLFFKPNIQNQTQLLPPCLDELVDSKYPRRIKELFPENYHYFVFGKPTAINYV
jgi:hypothetical protein